MRFLPVVLVLALTIYAVVDCIRTPGDEMKHLPKPVWLLVVVVVALVGPVLWLLTGRDRGAPSRPVPRPLAPDDDPDFLRRIAEQHRLDDDAKDGGTTEGDWPER